MSYHDEELAREEGREAYRIDRYSGITERRMRDAEYGGSEVDKAFREGFEKEERRVRERNEAEREENEDAIRDRQRLECNEDTQEDMPNEETP